MGHDIRFECDGRGVVITWHGAVSGEETIAANRAMYSQDDRHRLLYQIWDYSEADSIEISGDELRILAMQDRYATADNPNQIVALVGGREFFSGLDTLYSIYSEVWSGLQSRRFNGVSAAWDWIASVHPELSAEHN